MLRRLLTAAVGIPAVVLLVAFLPPPGLAFAAAALAAGGYLELVRLAAGHGVLAPRAPGAVLIGLAAAWPALEPWLGGATAGVGSGVRSGLIIPLALLALAIAGPREVSKMLPAAGTALLGWAWIGLGLGALVRLHGLPDGPALVFVLLAGIWLADSGAMWCGSRFGRRRLAPRLSPKKSWEGLVGGTLAAIGGVWAAAALLRPAAPFPTDLARLGALGVLLALAGTLGDLVESAFKRGAGTKDSGSFFPGHGGVLDRIDSLLFAAPVMYHWVEWAGGR